MKKILFAGSLLLVSVSAILTGCKKEIPPAVIEDVRKPEIFMSSPAIVDKGDFTAVYSGSTLPLDIRFEDDVELSDYQIRVFPMLDFPFQKKEFDIWMPTLVGFLDGNADGINSQIFVGSDPVAGYYGFEVTVTDKAGKSTVLTTYLYVFNSADTELPVVTITAPVPDTLAPETLVIGNNITVRGTATDNQMIEDITIQLRNKASDQVLTFGKVFVDTLYMGSYPIDTFLPTNAVETPPGTYEVEVIARDYFQNFTKKQSRIILIP